MYNFRIGDMVKVKNSVKDGWYIFTKAGSYGIVTSVNTTREQIRVKFEHITGEQGKDVHWYWMDSVNMELLNKDEANISPVARKIKQMERRQKFKFNLKEME